MKLEEPLKFIRWDEVPLEQLQTRISSRPDRMEAVISARVVALDGR